MTGVGPAKSRATSASRREVDHPYRRRRVPAQQRPCARGRGGRALAGLRVSQPDPFVEASLGLLAREALHENRPEVLWKAHIVDRQVRRALEDLFDAGADTSLASGASPSTGRSPA
jgi:hypothetical protein